MTRPAWPYLEQYRSPWIQHPDGLSYGPAFPARMITPSGWRSGGTLGHSSVRRGEYQYFLRFPEENPSC
jgi:hypothetical protein